MNYILKEELFINRIDDDNNKYELCVFMDYSIEQSLDLIISNTGDNLSWDYFEDSINYNTLVFIVYPTPGIVFVSEAYNSLFDFIIMG